MSRKFGQTKLDKFRKLFVAQSKEIIATVLQNAEQEIRATREARKNNKERLNDGAKRRIEILLGMTRSTREVTIGKNTFIFQSLKSKEISQAYMAAAEFDGTIQGPFEIRRQLLARSLTNISNIEFEQFIGSKSMEDKLLFIDEMDHALLSRLHNEYLELEKESRDKFAIKTEEDTKEVLEDLKK